MQPDSITPAAARITSLNLSDDIMLVQSKCSPNQGVRPRPRLLCQYLKPQTTRLCKSRYRLNRAITLSPKSAKIPEFRCCSRDAAAACDFFAASSWLPGAFLSSRRISVEQQPRWCYGGAAN